MIFTPSGVSHSLCVSILAWLFETCVGLPTFTTLIFPCRGPSLSFASLQKSTPLSPLLADLIFSSMPSGMTSPWQNQTDFWCGWSVVASPGAFSTGQPRVSGTPLGASTGYRYGLATDSATAYFATTVEPALNSIASFPATIDTSSARANAGTARTATTASKRQHMGKAPGVSERECGCSFGVRKASVKRRAAKRAPSE